MTELQDVALDFFDTPQPLEQSLISKLVKRLRFNADLVDQHCADEQSVVLLLDTAADTLDDLERRLKEFEAERSNGGQHV
jgi:hypothetical protein